MKSEPFQTIEINEQCLCPFTGIILHLQFEIWKNKHVSKYVFALNVHIVTADSTNGKASAVMSNNGDAQEMFDGSFM